MNCFSLREAVNVTLFLWRLKSSPSINPDFWFPSKWSDLTNWWSPWCCTAPVISQSSGCPHYCPGCPAPDLHYAVSGRTPVEKRTAKRTGQQCVHHCITLENYNPNNTPTHLGWYQRSDLVLVTFISTSPFRNSPLNPDWLKELDTLLIMRNFLTYFAGAPDKESLESILVKLWQLFYGLLETLCCNTTVEEEEK